MPTQTLSRHGTRTWPELPVLDGLGLARGRVHELCGPARRSFAVFVLAASRGPAIWIFPGWERDRLHPAGLADYCDPGRLILVRARRPDEALWAMEEALRSGAAEVVCVDLAQPPALTPVRRLHLSAGAAAGSGGAGSGGAGPVGLLLTPGDGGAPGVESRWHMAQDHVLGLHLWRLERRRARTSPPQSWLVDFPPGGTPRVGPHPACVADAVPAARAAALRRAGASRVRREGLSAPPAPSPRIFED